MPIISGGGGGGVTTAQVVTSGKVIPAASPTGATVDATTYVDPIAGGGAKLTTLVFPSNVGALAIALAGDAFPRWLMASNAMDGLYIGPGSSDAYNDGVAITRSGPALLLEGGNASLQIGVTGANRGIHTSTSGGVLVQASSGGMLTTGTGVPAVGAETGDFYFRVNGPPYLYRCTVAGGAGVATWVALIGNPTISGALATIAPVSGTAFQCLTTRDVFLCVPFTGDATNNAATLLIQLSPDNVTFSTLDTLSIAAALNLTGAINIPVTLAVPQAWYVKLTASHGTIGTSTYY